MNELHNADETTMNSEPIFIVGMPRSGTTLLASLLSAHSRIAISPESHFLNRFVREHQRLRLSDPADFERFWRAFCGAPRFGYFGVAADEVRRRVESLGVPSFATVFQALLETYAASLHKPRWGEKTPAHYLHVATLLDWQPQGRVLWMVRDPRAVSASLLGTPWGGRHVQVHARSWCDCMRRLERLADDPRVLPVRYERLASDPAETTREICRFLGEEHEAAMLAERSTDSSPIVGRVGWAAQHLQASLKPVSSESLEKWRGVLGERRRAVIELVAGEMMRRHEYVCEGIDSGARWRLALADVRYQCERVLRAPQRLRRLVERAA